MARRYPSAKKLPLGLGAAALVAALPTLLLGTLAAAVFPIAFIVALIHAVVLGLPAYLLLRRWFRLNYANATAAGLVIGALPIFVYLVLTGLETEAAYPGYDFSLAAQLRDGAWMAGIFGVLGAIGGLAFRGVLGPDEDVFEVDPSIFE